MITRSADIANLSFIHSPPFPIEDYMLGMPASTQTVTHVEPVTGSYAG